MPYQAKTCSRPRTRPNKTPHGTRHARYLPRWSTWRFRSRDWCSNIARGSMNSFSVSGGRPLPDGPPPRDALTRATIRPLLARARASGVYVGRPNWHETRNRKLPKRSKRHGAATSRNQSLPFDSTSAAPHRSPSPQASLAIHNGAAQVPSHSHSKAV